MYLHSVLKDLLRICTESQHSSHSDASRAWALLWKQVAPLLNEDMDHRSNSLMVLYDDYCQRLQKDEQHTAVCLTMMCLCAGIV